MTSSCKDIEMDDDGPSAKDNLHVYKISLSVITRSFESKQVIIRL